MRHFAFVLLALFAACAGNRVASAPCEPVPAEFLTRGPVYRDCAVDRKARAPSTLPPLRMVDMPKQWSGCSKVVVELVIDSTGAPVTHTAKVVQSNDPQFQQLVMASLGALHYTPAMKGDARVAQLVRYERKMQFMVAVTSVSGGGTGGAPPPPIPARAPNC